VPSIRVAAATAAVAAASLLLSLTAAPTSPAQAQGPQQFCPPMQRPSAHLTTYFTQPGSSSVSPVTKALVGLTCAAAPKATIRIALYYLDYIGPDSEVNHLLGALEYVHRTRQVKIKVVLERQQFASGDPEFIAPLRRLRQFAHVNFCRLGCMYERPPGNSADLVQHMKFFIVGDTLWRSGQDRVVFQSSANWSWTQLREREQSAIMVWDDPVLYREFATRWGTLYTCAAWKRGCSAWNGQLSTLRLDRASYGIADHSRLWTEAIPHQRPGSPGRGVRVFFAPWPAPDDPVARELLATKCGRGGEVRLGEVVVSADRPRVIDALSTLKRHGCSVRVLVSATTWQPIITGVRTLRRAGLDVGCVAGLHDKFMTFNSHVGSTRSRRLVWAGSQNLYALSLRADDEEVLRVSVLDARGSAIPENVAAYAAYRAHWAHMSTRRTSCPSVATKAPSTREPLL